MQFFKGLSQVHGLGEEISRNFGRLRATLKKKRKFTTGKVEGQEVFSGLVKEFARSEPSRT